MGAKFDIYGTSRISMRPKGEKINRRDAFLSFSFFSFFFFISFFSFFTIDSSGNQKGTLVYKRVPAVRMLPVHRFDFVSSLLSDRSGSPTPYYVTSDARSSASARVGGCTSPDFNFV